MQGLGPEDDVDEGRAVEQRRAFLAGHAAPHADEQVRVGVLELLQPPQVRAHLVLRLVADGAGVEDDEIGILGLGRALPTLFGLKDVGDLLRVVGVHLAPEGAHVDLVRGHGVYPEAKAGDVTGSERRNTGVGARKWRSGDLVRREGARGGTPSPLDSYPPAFRERRDIALEAAAAKMGNSRVYGGGSGTRTPDLRIMIPSL